MAVLTHETYRFGELNPLLFTDHIDRPDAKVVSISAGWESNYTLLADFMRRLQECGVESYAYSPFDAVDPLSEPSSWWTDQSSGVRFDIGLTATFDDYPLRMLDRARRLITAMMEIPEVLGIEQPDVAVGHCAGNNVLLLAAYLAKLNPILGSIGADRLLLVEPMLPYWAEVIQYTTKGGFSKFERASRIYPALISLKSLAHPDMPDLAMARVEPLGDIIRSRGLDLAVAVSDSGVELVAVTSKRDYAAPEEAIRGTISDVRPYPDQQRFGHGYIYAEPGPAAKHIASVLGPWFKTSDATDML